MKNIESVLTLERLVFNNIEFNRKGFKNDNEITFSIEVQIGKRKSQNGISQVTLILKGDKEDEYDFTISLSGFFSFNTDEEVDDALSESLINRNAVAILMPFMRSQVSLLTAQPEVDCVVLPPFNINAMMEEGTQE